MSYSNHLNQLGRSRMFTWAIKEFSASSARKRYSDVFVLDGYQWRLLIFPKGNSVDKLSIYLDVADSSELPDGWNRYAEFGVSVLNQVNSQHTVRKDTYHSFNSRESDWGFTSFMPLSDVYDSSKGYLVNATLILEVDIVNRNESEVKKDLAGPVQQVVHFRSLEKPNEDVFGLELLILLGYDEVALKVARHLGVHDSLRIRLTRHNWDSGEPEPTAIEYKATDRLRDLLAKSDETLNILYYEVLGKSKAGTVDNMTEQNMSSSCVICWSEPKEAACVPCGHVAACMSCLSKIKDKMFGCPVCRAQIQQVIRIFVA